MDPKYLQFIKDQLEAIKKVSLGNLPKIKAPNKFYTTCYLLENRSSMILPKGLWLEFGVFQGTSINLMANKCPDVTLYGFDSFEGFPEDKAKEWNAKYPKDFSLQGNLPSVRKNVKLIKGWFDHTLPKFLKLHPDEPVAYLHIDCDLYASTKLVLTLLRDRLRSGTIIVFDELVHFNGFEEHEIKAWYEFVKENNIKYEWIGIKNKVLSWDEYVKKSKHLRTFKDFRRHDYQQEVALRIL